MDERLKCGDCQKAIASATTPAGTVEYQASKLYPDMPKVILKRGRPVLRICDGGIGFAGDNCGDTSKFVAMDPANPVNH